MAVDRYVVVSEDTTDLVIKNGPFKWDPANAYDPGPGLVMRLESEALDAGYGWPPPPPAEG